MERNDKVQVVHRKRLWRRWISKAWISVYWFSSVRFRYTSWRIHIFVQSDQKLMTCQFCIVTDDFHLWKFFPSTNHVLATYLGELDLKRDKSDVQCLIWSCVLVAESHSSFFFFGSQRRVSYVSFDKRFVTFVSRCILSFFLHCEIGYDTYS